MSMVERLKPKTFPPLEAGQLLDRPTFHERYEAMQPETRAELVGGVVYMPSPMSVDRGDTSLIVAGWLDRYRRFTPRIRGAVGATVKLYLKGEPQPDAFLFILCPGPCPTRRSRGAGRGDTRTRGLRGEAGQGARSRRRREVTASPINSAESGCDRPHHLGSFFKIRASSWSIFWTRFLATKTWAIGICSFLAASAPESPEITVS